MVSKGSCCPAYLVCVLLLDFEPLPVHLFDEFCLSGLPGPMGRHVLYLIMHFLKYPKRGLRQQVWCKVVQQAL